MKTVQEKLLSLATEMVSICYCLMKTVVQSAEVKNTMRGNKAFEVLFVNGKWSVLI